MTELFRSCGAKGTLPGHRDRRGSLGNKIAFLRVTLAPGRNLGYGCGVRPETRDARNPPGSGLLLHGLRSTPGPGGRPKSWHVLEVKPFYGHAVDRFIEFKRDAVGADWELFNPKVRAQKKWSRGRTGVSVRSYLPGYVFARFDVDDGKWPHLNDVIGIDSVMYSVGNDPATVRDAVICDLMGRCAVEYEDGDFEQRKPRYFIDEAEADAYLFKVGSLVRMTEGPFKDMVGEVKMSTRMKVTVIFSVFNRDSRVEAKPGNLELV